MQILKHKDGISNYIELQLAHYFIKKYDLIKVVNDSIYHHYIFNYDNDGFVNYSFNPIFFNKGQLEKLTEYINLFQKLFIEYNIGEPHKDHLVFLSKCYNQIASINDLENIAEYNLRSRGKLLVDLIKVPFRKYTIESIYDAFKDEKLDDDEISEFLITYLSIETNLIVNDLQKENGKLNLKSLSEEQKYKLLRRIHADKNISIKMENGNFLIVSNTIKLKFSYENSDGKNITVENDQQSQALNRVIIKNLLNEQKENETELYLSLLKHDFLEDSNNRNLSNKVGLWNSGLKAKNAKVYYDFIQNYLVGENLLKRSSETDTKRIRSNFIYHYFILVNVFENIVTDSIKQITVAHFSGKIKQYLVEKRSNPNYSKVSFHKMFKKIPDKDK